MRNQLAEVLGSIPYATSVSTGAYGAYRGSTRGA
jgi:hypothetical protein